MAYVEFTGNLCACRKNSRKLTSRGESGMIGLASKSGKVVHFLKRRCAMVTYDALFAYSMVLIGLASLIYTVTRHKK